MEKLNKLIQEHKLSREECSIQLNELTEIDKTKFSKKEIKDIEDSILELEVEKSMRSLFISELQTLL